MQSQAIKDKGKVFRDPVHRLIRIEQDDQFILDLVNAPEFQRLRRVRQLGVSSFTYHGAEHSRFVHSLGVYNFAQRIIAALQRRYSKCPDVVELLQTHARVAKAAALLHDLGHGPFSHMIERASGSSFDHEEMTAKLITNEAGTISQVLRGASINPQDVADVIRKTYPHSLIVDIVSSQLDADRMDYLLRDSLMTGVEYGVYDAEWLLNAMCVGRDPSADNGSQNVWRLCLDRDRGLFAAEQLILARHHMMLQVYMHRVTRGYEVMLLNLFHKAASLVSTNSLPSGTPPSIASYFRSGIEMPLEHWLLFDETAMVAAIQAWTGAEGDEHAFLRRVSNAFLMRERRYAGFELTTRRPALLMDLQNGLESANLVQNEDWGLDDGEHLPYKGVYYQAARGGGDEEFVGAVNSVKQWRSFFKGQGH
ncbi:MAG TPA: HD domain-containing protein [Phycisphaerales bacterium]|nr:HD domain-containing protein [Phycisphaerales bacterium]